MSKSFIHTPALEAEICERIAHGEPLRVICRDAHMPSWVTVYEWRKTNPQFAEALAVARDVGYDAIAEEALEIADTTQIGERTEDSDTGCKIVREDMLGHRKLRIDTRLKLLAKWSPKRYGDKLDVTSDGEAVTLSPEERAAKLAALAGLAARRKADSEDGSDLL